MVDVIAHIVNYVTNKKIKLNGGKVKLLTLQASLHYADRSSHRWYSVRKGVLRNFAKSTKKHQCQSLFFNKVAGLRHATL